MKFLNNITVDKQVSTEIVKLTPTAGEGELSWNDVDGTANLKLKGGQVTLQLGQEMNELVYNAESVSLNPGDVVYSYGSVGLHTSVKLANCSLEETSKNTMAVVTEVIPSLGLGFATTMGRIRDLDTSAFLANDVIYLSDVDGTFTNIKPQSPKFVVKIGYVSKVGTTDGEIKIDLSAVPNADEISYNNTNSLLTATNVKSAIDELNMRKADVSLLSSNITLYATNGSADIGGYYKLVTSVEDPSYNDTPVDIPTGAILTDNQLLSNLVASPNLFIGNPGVINISTIGNISKVTGNANQYAEFFFRVYKRNLAGTEELIATSDTTGPINFEDSNYHPMSATAMLNNGIFIDTDRIVVKYFANDLGSSTGATYSFQFGGSNPVRTLLPVPVSVIPSGAATNIVVDTASFNGVLSGTDSTLQSALNTIDDHNHNDLYYTETEVNNLFANLSTAAEDTTISDAGGYYTATNVETALQEAGLVNQIIQNETGITTGFTNNANIIVTYSSVNRTITLNGTFKAYFKGVLVPSLTDGWVSTPHTNATGAYFLYYRDGFVWSTSPWLYSDIMIAFVQYGTNNLGLREVHGFMSALDHEHDHQTIGTYKVSGGDLTGYVVNSTTAANRRPDVGTTTLRDEDLTSVISALSTKQYTQRYLTGAGVRTFATTQADIVALSGNQPYWNQNNAGTWQQTLFANGEYGCVFVVAIPTTADSGSLVYRYLFTQPQFVSTDINLVRAFDSGRLVHGDAASLVTEYVFFARIMIRYQGGNWTIIEVDKLEGTKISQISSTAGTFLSTVTTDASLTGSGTAISPLSIVDGPGSNLDADTLDGIQATGFATASHTHIDLASESFAIAMAIALG